MHVGVYLLLHVVILVLHHSRYRSFAVFLVHLLCTASEEHLAVLEGVAVVVANDIAHLCRLDVRLYSQQVIESLVAFGLFGSLLCRQHACELCRQTVGVDHLALSISRMNAHALDGHLARSGVEVLKLQVAEVAAVHSVCPLAAELLHIEVVRAHAYLLVRVEAHADISVLYLLMVAQVAHRLHYLGYSCLVVGAQQRCAVGNDEVLAHMMQQFGELLRTAHDAWRQFNVAAVIVAHDVCLDVCSAAVGAGVIVAYETYCGYLLLRV